MIIVKRTAGDVFINEKTVQSVMHDKQSKSVLIKDVEGKPSDAFYEVEFVGYTNDAQPTQWMDEGSEIQRLKSEYEKLKKEFSQSCERIGYIRELYWAYESALMSIKELAKQEERKGENIKSPLDIIEEAEMKCKESQKKFEKAKAKWEE
jgi:predicted thioredoxin/glutaredoxin